MKIKIHDFLQGAEAQHERLVVLHKQKVEQINKLVEESKGLVYELTILLGEIQGYKKVSKIIEQYEE